METFSHLKFIACRQSAQDFDTLKAIHKTCMKQNIIDSLGTWDSEAQQQRLSKHYKDYGSTLQFIYSGSDLVGTVNFHTKPLSSLSDKDTLIECNFIEQLYILPAYQRQGIGSFIMKEFDTYPNLRLSVLCKDTKAQNFYSHLGYNIYHQDEYQVFFEKIHLFYNLK